MNVSFYSPQFKIARASHLDIKSEQGCFADKVFRQTATDLQKLVAFKSELMQHDSWRGTHNQVVYGVSDPDHNECIITIYPCACFCSLNTYVELQFLI